MRVRSELTGETFEITSRNMALSKARRDKAYARLKDLLAADAQGQIAGIWAWDGVAWVPVRVS